MLQLVHQQNATLDGKLLIEEGLYMETIGMILFGVIIIALLFFTSIVRGNAWKGFLDKLSGKDNNKD